MYIEHYNTLLEQKSSDIFTFKGYISNLNRQYIIFYLYKPVIPLRMVPLPVQKYISVFIV